MFKFELKGLEKALQNIDLDRKKIEKVVKRTLDKTATQAKNAASREIRSVYNIKKERLDAGLKIVQVARYDNPMTIIRAKGKVPGLQNFDPKVSDSRQGTKWYRAARRRNTKEGADALLNSTGSMFRVVSVKVRKAGGYKAVDGAFMGKGVNFGEYGDVTSGATGTTDLIWKRTGEGKRRMTKGRYAGKLREPIRKLSGPDVVGMMNMVGTAALTRTVGEKLGQIFDHEFAYEMNK